MNYKAKYWDTDNKRWNFVLTARLQAEKYQTPDAAVRELSYILQETRFPVGYVLDENGWPVRVMIARIDDVGELIIHVFDGELS